MEKLNECKMKEVVQHIKDCGSVAYDPELYKFMHSDETLEFYRLFLLERIADALERISSNLIRL